ncbi:hypothetical protein J437_LFUL001027 [Ladona fulva]|uniref:Uncharacterized protein n=1 Tax=Ladona fulva TaxID=123851 RepID=A0A8K0P4P1_LADFU|nr:hypothetical protein J437_LFUL001027 [Ladona fulva]
MEDFVTIENDTDVLYFLGNSEDVKQPEPAMTVWIEENVQEVAEILRNGRCASTRIIEGLTGIPKSTVHLIFTEN